MDTKVKLSLIPVLSVPTVNMKEGWLKQGNDAWIYCDTAIF